MNMSLPERPELVASSLKASWTAWDRLGHSLEAYEKMGHCALTPGERAFPGDFGQALAQGIPRCT